MDHLWFTGTAPLPCLQYRLGTMSYPTHLQTVENGSSLEPLCGELLLNGHILFAMLPKRYCRMARVVSGIDNESKRNDRQNQGQV
jgi:hypothetical protein